MVMTRLATGFRLGKYALTPCPPEAEVHYKGRAYKVLWVRTNEGLYYVSLRLYNGRGKFIKQLLIDPPAVSALAAALSRIGRHERCNG